MNRVWASIWKVPIIVAILAVAGGLVLAYWLWFQRESELPLETALHLGGSKVRLSPDDRYVAVWGGGEVRVRAWSNNAPAESRAFNFSQKVERDAGDFSPDGALLALAAKSDIVLWDYRKNEKRLTIPTGHRSGVESIVFAPDGGHWPLPIRWR